MFKVLLFAKRKPGIDRSQFIEIYERDHIALTDRLAGEGKIPSMLEYRRNYVVHDDPINAGTVDFDVVTEVVFEDRAAYEANRAAMADPEIGKLVGEDMASFLDLSNLKFIVVETYSGGGGAQG